MIRGFIRLGIFLLISTVIQAQSLFYREYTEDQGLENTEINVLIQDQHGYLWIGTMTGLYKFDGSSFTELLYNDINTDKAVYDLAIDQNQVMWIAGENGITSFNGANFLHFDLNSGESPRTENPQMAVIGTHVYYFNGSGLLYRIKNNRVEDLSGALLNVEDKIVDIHAKAADTLWLLSGKGYLYCLADRSIQDPFPISKGSEKFLGINNAPNKSAESIEIITDQGVLDFILPVKQDPPSLTWKIRQSSLQAIFSDSYRQTWIVTNNTLLKIRDTDTLNIDIRIPPKANIFFYEDIEKNTWVAISKVGLYHFTGEEIIRLWKENPGNYTPSSYVNYRNKLWISYFGAGVKKQMNTETFEMENQEGLISNYVRDMLLYEDEIWFITARGVTRMKDEHMVHYTTEDGLPHNYCYKAAVDLSGRIWIGTEMGIAVFEKDKFRVLNRSEGAPQERVKYLYPLPDGTMLILKESGIDQYDQTKIRSFVYEGLNNKEILNTVSQDQFGNFWIGSDLNGLIYFNSRQGRVEYVSKDLGIPFSRVRAIVPYGKDNLCLGTEEGIFTLRINDTGDLIMVQPYGLERGYPDFEVNQNAFLPLGDRLFFGTSIGTIIFQPEKVKRIPSAPVPNLTGLDLSFKETDWSGTSQKLNTWFQIPEEPILDYDENDLMFHFNGVSLQSGDKLWYRYRLDNYDNTWSDPTRNTSALYANLLPGEYTFLVKGSYDGINWNDQFTSYTLIIAPPFWKTWWFYAIMLSFLLAGFILFNNYRIKTKVNQLIAIERLKKEEYNKIQKKVAMDFHDEVGNHLTSISLLVELIKSRDWKVEDELKMLLNKIDEESKNLFGGTRDFIWSIDPVNDNLKAVYLNIRDYATDLFDNSNIHFHAQNGNADIGAIKLPAGFTRHIVLIFKEGLNNVLKHTGCKNVFFSIEIKGKVIEIKLKDDGKGIRPMDLQHLEGIKKMKYRGAKIKSDLILVSDEKLGTEIILKAKV